jgi:hypothetical protein
MKKLSSFVRSAAVALALAFVAAPTVALADEPAAGHREHGKQHGDRAAFPMKADAFQQLVERRIAKAHEHMERILTGKAVPEVVATAVRKDFEDGAGRVRAAAKAAEKNGVVSKEEARAVRELAKDIVDRMRDKYGMPKGEHPKGKRADAHGRGQKKAHGKKA